MKGPWLPVLLGLALSAPLAAAAQVYRCGKGAEAVFTDKPCADPAAGPVKPSAPVGPQGSLDFQVGTRHYPVNGSNFRAAYHSLRANNPGGFAGWARWTVDYSFDSNPVGSQCAVAAVRVKVMGDILMPEWIEEPSARPADQHSWRTMYAGLKRHEDGHIQNGREFALLLKERLMGMGTMPCDALQSRMQLEYQRLYANLHSRDQEYDRRTSHGLRQDNPQ